MTFDNTICVVKVSLKLTQKTLYGEEKNGIGLSWKALIILSKAEKYDEGNQLLQKSIFLIKIFFNYLKILLKTIISVRMSHCFINSMKAGTEYTFLTMVYLLLHACLRQSRHATNISEISECTISLTWTAIGAKNHVSTKMFNVLLPIFTFFLTL